jgi:hypothetical protein
VKRPQMDCRMCTDLYIAAPNAHSCRSRLQWTTQAVGQHTGTSRQSTERILRTPCSSSQRSIAHSIVAARNALPPPWHNVPPPQYACLPVTLERQAAQGTGTTSGTVWLLKHSTRTNQVLLESHQEHAHCKQSRGACHSQICNPSGNPSDGRTCCCASRLHGGRGAACWWRGPCAAGRGTSCRRWSAPAARGACAPGSRSS